MEKFFALKDERRLITWLLQQTGEQNWIILLEYEKPDTHQLLIQNATETDMPVSAKHNYNEDYLLTAIKNPVVTNKWITNIFKNCSALSAHKNGQMIFLAADDFHKSCFSCSVGFFNEYHQILKDNSLVR